MDKEFYMTPNSEESNLVLKQALKELIEDMYEKNIISGLLEDDIDSQSFEDLVLSLRDKLKECYPKTKGWEWKLGISSAYQGTCYR